MNRRRERLSVQEMSLAGLFAALIAAGAFMQVTIPVQPVPMHFTMQFFFVLLASFLLGPKLGMASVGLYLAVGLVGVPVFASGGGPAYLLRPTFGFLLGFWAAAAAAGYGGAVKGGRPSFRRLVLSALAGMAAMYLCGMGYFYAVSNLVLGIHVTWKLVAVNCFLLTVWGDGILCFLASAAALRLKPALDWPG